MTDRPIKIQGWSSVAPRTLEALLDAADRPNTEIIMGKELARDICTRILALEAKS